MKPPESLDLVTLCCRALDNKKAGELRVLHPGPQSSITDYLIVATATSEPHLRALRLELERVVKEAGVRVVGVENPPESGWTVVDLFEVMVHLFIDEARRHYRLESLWKDAEELSVPELLGEVKPQPKKKPARAKAPAKKTPRKAAAKKPAKQPSKPAAKKKPAPRKPAARKKTPKK